MEDYLSSGSNSSDGVMQGARECLQSVILQYLESVLDLVRAFVMTRDGADWRR